ncbi:MAG: dual specificity protein phosphatase family protein [Oligoflexia bacterium]|nr:dual specificity protein phosphatase family protein [Oligoflexia bacterium]
MYKITWIIENKLATRPGPQEYPWNISEIKNQGINVIISLSNEGEETDIKNAKIKHYKFYTEDIELTNDHLINAFIDKVQDAIDIIHQELSSNNVVLVHCHAGRDRTGFVVAAYLTKYMNMSPEDALKKMRKLRPYCVYPGYEKALYLYQKSE